MNHTRLKNVFFRAKKHGSQFDMLSWTNDLAHHAACLAVGEEIGDHTVIEYRGQETHIEDVATLFLEASEKEADKLFYLGCWPDDAWRRYRKGNRIGALLITVNILMIPE